jgi:tetratricopeptide (TPR) repeat protein/cephalosporin hydroxylase
MKLTILQTLQQGVAAHNAGNLQEAERAYRNILQSQPQHPDANHNLGLIAISLNQVESALPLFKAALDINPNIEQFWISYIDALVKNNHLKDAKQGIKKAKKKGVDANKLESLLSQSKVVIDTKAPTQELINRLIEHYQNGQLDDAEKLSLSITQAFPEHPIGWKVLGAVLKETGRLLDSLTAMQKSVQLAPNDVEAINNLGTALNELKRFEEAEACYKKAIVLKPDFAKTHYNLGIMHKEQGKFDDAEMHLRQAINLEDTMGDAYLSLSNILRYGESVEDSIAYQIKGLKLTSAKIESNANLNNMIPKFVKKLQGQNWIPTFFDKYVSSHLKNKINSSTDYCDLFEDGQLSKDNRFIKYSERVKSTSTSLPDGRLFDGLPISISQGVHSLIKWKEYSLYKMSSDCVLYWMILQEVQPTVIIELGSGDGGSAIWLADMARALGINTHIYSYDINELNLDYEGVTFIKYDLMNINQRSKPPYWEFFIGRKLLIEDAHVNLANILNLFDDILVKDDYVILEDSDSKQELIHDFMFKKGSKYKVDQFFLDFFGKNITCSKNSIFKVF